MTAYDDLVLSHAPNFYYKMNEASGSLIDSSGNGRNAGVVGSVARNQASLFPDTLQTASTLFNADGGYFSHARPSNFGNFTIVCWFATSSTMVATATQEWWRLAFFYGIEDSGIENDFGVGWDGGKLMFGTGNPDNKLVTTANWNDGLPHMAAFTRALSGTTKRIYVDGVERASAATNGNSLNVNANRFIGRNVSGTSAQYYGKMSHLALFDKVLTATEIAEMFTTGTVLPIWERSTSPMVMG